MVELSGLIAEVNMIYKKNVENEDNRRRFEEIVR